MKKEKKENKDQKTILVSRLTWKQLKQYGIDKDLDVMEEVIQDLLGVKNDD